MADTERREDQEISRCLQEAFGYTDEQLLKQLDQANKTLKDVTFDGAEDRLKKRFLERKAEFEKEEAASVPETKTQEKKIVRFRKKKVLATAVLVAVIAGMLGGTAVGKKNYFFRHSIHTSGTILVDNDKNKQDDSKLEAAYTDIANNIEGPLLKLGYYPMAMHYKNYQLYKDEAQIDFTYEENSFTIYIIENDKSTSINFESDRKSKKTIFNKRINREIVYSENNLQNGLIEYETVIVIEQMSYYLIGTMPENEYKKILENLNIF